MATNDFLPFCGTTTGTNLLTQADYITDAQRPIGNQPGVARSKLVNKALRQATWIAAQLAQFVSDQTGDDMLDDENATNAQATLLKALNHPTVAIVNETQASGVDAGGFTSGAWQTRVLNTTQSAQTWMSLSANQITLTAGTYLVHASAPAANVNLHKARLQNITDSSTAIVGTSNNNQNSTSHVIPSTVDGVITIAGTKTFEIQHQCSSTAGTNGLGIASGFGVSEIYTVVVITKLK